MPKYTANDLVAHTAKNGTHYPADGKVLDNGMLAGFVRVAGKKDPQFRLIKVVDKAAHSSALAEARKSPKKELRNEHGNTNTNVAPK